MRHLSKKLNDIIRSKRKRTNFSAHPLRKVFWIWIMIGSLILWWLLLYFFHGMPSIESIASGNFFRESSVIYDKDGNEIYSIFKDWKRTYIQYDTISQSIKDAIISAEDRTFFEIHESILEDLSELLQPMWQETTDEYDELQPFLSNLLKILFFQMKDQSKENSRNDIYHIDWIITIRKKNSGNVSQCHIIWI